MIKSGISKKTTTTTASHYVTLELETAVMVLSFKIYTNAASSNIAWQP